MTRGRFSVGDRVLIRYGNHEGERGVVVKVDRGEDDALDSTVDDLVYVRAQGYADRAPMLFGHDSSLDELPNADDLRDALRDLEATLA